MRTWLRIALATIAFWAVWVGIAGLAATIHGDCGVGATELQAAACVSEKRRVALAVMAIGAIAYAIALWLWVKRTRHRSDGH